MITYNVCLCPTHQKRKRNQQDIWNFEVWLVQAPVIQTLDSTTQIAIQWISISLRKINCVIHCLGIYPVDSVIHLLNNWAQVLTSQAKNGVQMPLLMVTGPPEAYMISRMVRNSWVLLACLHVASISNRVIVRKLEREQKNKEEGRGGEKRKHLSANPMILENALWYFTVWFIWKLTACQDRSQYIEQITRYVKFTLFSNKTDSTRLQKM